MAEDRDDKGRFLPGHKGAANAGRPPRAVEENYLAILRSVVTPEEFELVVRSLLCAAKKKNIQAIKLLLSYLLGNPPETVNLNGDLRTLIEYVNDWRTWQDPPPCPTSGAAGSEDTGAPLQLAGGGPEVA
jgi:hypothetical protein